MLFRSIGLRQRRVRQVGRERVSDYMGIGAAEATPVTYSKLSKASIRAPVLLQAHTIFLGDHRQSASLTVRPTRLCQTVE